MSSSRPKEFSRGANKTPQVVAPNSTAAEAISYAGDLDMNLLQTMMDSLWSDIFGQIDDLATNLQSDIASVRQKLKSSIEPL